MVPVKTTAALLLAVAGVLALAGCGGSSSNDNFTMMQYGPGMMGYGPLGSGTPVRTLERARRQAQRFADKIDLRVGEVMRFTRNYYA